MAQIRVSNDYRRLGDDLDMVQVFPILGDGNCFLILEDPLLCTFRGACGCQGRQGRKQKSYAVKEGCGAIRLAHGHSRIGRKEGAEAWAKNMRKPGAWADQVAIAATAAYLKRCIFVTSYNSALKSVYMDKYVDTCESVEHKVIPLFYDGNHYELGWGVAWFVGGLWWCAGMV